MVLSVNRSRNHAVEGGAPLRMAASVRLRKGVANMVTIARKESHFTESMCSDIVPAADMGGLDRGIEQDVYFEGGRRKKTGKDPLATLSCT